MFWKKLLGSFDPIKQWTSFIELIIALCIALGVVSSFFSSFISAYTPPEYISFIKGGTLYICALFMTFRITGTILSARNNRNTNRNGQGYKYPLQLRIFCKVVRGISLTGILIAVFLLFQLHSKILRDCQENEDKLAIFVAKFSEKQDPGFVGQMMNDLHSKILDTGLIIDKLDKHLATISEFQLRDSISKFSKCYKKTILIYGSRDVTDGIFFCNIYLHNVMTQCSSVRIGDSLIRVEDPKIIEFKTAPEQVDVISNLVQSLIFSSHCEHRAAIDLVNHIRSGKLSIHNSKLLAYCSLIKGNSFVRLGLLDSARKSYLEGLKSEPLNHLLITNLARLGKKELNVNEKGEVDTFEKTEQFEKAIMSFTFPMDKVFKDEVTFERTFAVGEEAYFFKGGEKIDSLKVKNSDFVYFYTLLPNSKNYLKLNLANCKKGVFSFLLPENFAKIDFSRMNATLTFIFPDKTVYRVKSDRIKFLN